MSPNLAAVATFEEAAPRYDSSGAQLAGPIADRLVSLASLRPGDQVVDIGCGAGAVTIRAARAVSPGDPRFLAAAQAAITDLQRRKERARRGPGNRKRRRSPPVAAAELGGYGSVSVPGRRGPPGRAAVGQ